MNFDYKPKPNEKPLDNRITLPAMQRVIKACEQFNFWFFMLGTVNGLSDTLTLLTRRQHRRGAYKVP